MTTQVLQWTLVPSKIGPEDAVLPWVTLDADQPSNLCRACQYLSFRFFFTHPINSITNLQYRGVVYSRVDSIGIGFSTIGNLRRRCKECAFCKLVWHELKTQCDMANVSDYHEGDPVICHLSNSFVGPYGLTSHIPDNNEPWRLVIEVTANLWFDHDTPPRHEQGLAYITCDDLELGMGRVLQPKTNTRWMARVLDLCESAHGGHPDEACPARVREEHIVTRFIDVKEMRIVQRSTRTTRFAALSYVWGSSSSVTLNSANTSILGEKGGLNSAWGKVPATIKDAVVFCQYLNIDYLWVDALCIVQDSDEKIDQIEKMGNIYCNAYITIAAATGADADVGLAGLSPRSLIPSTSNVNDFKLINLCRSTVDSSTWNTRAWTYQERLLSPRLFVFTEQDTWFYCKHGTSQESSMLDIHEHSHLVSCIEPSQGDFTLDSAATIDFDVYVRTVAEFSSRKLTHPDDVINAVSGLMAVVAKSFTNTEFQYGMPIHLMDMALLWRSIRPLQRRLGWPSWSWAGWIGSVTYADLIHFGDRTRACLMPYGEGRTSDSVRPDTANLSEWHRHYDEEDASIYYTHDDEDQNRWHCRPSPSDSFSHLTEMLRSEGTLEFQTKVAHLFVSSIQSSRLKSAFSYYQGTKSRFSKDATHIRPLKILDDREVHIGIVFLDTSPDTPSHPVLDCEHRLICLSRTTYAFGDLDPAWDEGSNAYAGTPGAPAINPQDVEEISGFPQRAEERANDEWFDSTVYEFNICWALYNVMMVSKDNERLGVGKVHVHAFDQVAAVESVQLH